MKTDNNAKVVMGILILIILILLYKLFYSPVPTPDENHLITIEKAREFEDEYVRTRYGLINESLDITDNREYLISLDFLEEYIAYVKREGKKLGYTGMGLRIYNAAYPENSQDERTQPGLSTIILVPTHTVENSGLGFIPLPLPYGVNSKSIQAANYINGGHRDL